MAEGRSLDEMTLPGRRATDTWLHAAGNAAPAGQASPPAKVWPPSVAFLPHVQRSQVDNLGFLLVDDVLTLLGRPPDAGARAPRDLGARSVLGRTVARALNKPDAHVQRMVR